MSGNQFGHCKSKVSTKKAPFRFLAWVELAEKVYQSDAVADLPVATSPTAVDAP